jgi:hypothetical protein
MSSDQRITRVVNEHKQPVQLTLTRGAKGIYRWQIDIRAEDVDQALYMLGEADRKLREQFLEQPLPNQPVEAAGPDKPKDPHSKMDQALHNIKKAGEKLTGGGEQPR